MVGGSAGLGLRVSYRVSGSSNKDALDDSSRGRAEEDDRSD